jgi:hypothetical protein
VVRPVLFAGAVALSGCGFFSRSASVTRTSVALPPPRVIAGEIDGRAVLGDVPARAQRLGAGAPALVAFSEAVDNDWVGGFVEVPKDDCLLGYARGSASIDDVDVAIYSEEGSSLAVDEGRDVHPTVLICAPHPDRVYVAAHVVEGEGVVAVGAQLVPKDRAVLVARGLAARGTLGQGPRPADAWPGLEDIVRAHRAGLGGAWQELKRVALSVDARMPTVAPLPIDADQCIDAVVIPDEDVALLDVEAVDEEGRVVARAREGMGARTLTVCSPIAMAGTLTVRPHLGSGLAAIVIARARGEVARDLSVRPEIAWVAASEPLDVAKRARDTLLAKSGYAAALATVSGKLEMGHRLIVPLDLKALAGACSRIDVVAGAPLALVTARVSDDSGAVLASADASSSLALFACAHGPVRLELEARGRPGPFAVTARSEPWKDRVFASRPLAASRMLARAAVGPDMLLGGKELTARELSLDGGHVISWNESVPAARCLRVTVGGQGSGEGLELRVFDATNGEVDRSEAAHAASVRACAPADSARSIRLELQAGAGQMDAIVGERTYEKD